MTALTTGSPLLDAYRLADLVARVAAECPDLVADLVDAQRLLAEGGDKSQVRFAEARVEGCEGRLIADSAALRRAAGLEVAR